MSTELEQFLSNQNPSGDDYNALFEQVFSGNLNDVQIAAALGAIRVHREKTPALYAGALAMRNAVRKFTLSETAQGEMIDNCGTGGDGLNTFNISTASALVAASAGARLAKHGNRSVSSKCGSADLLYELGYPDTLTDEQTIDLLEKKGFAFFFAPGFHPNMKHVMPARKALGVRTVFNFLGPLVHPLMPPYQLLGVGQKEFHRPVAETLLKLGVKRAGIVHSRDGMDEISPCAITDVYWIENNKMSELQIDPSRFFSPVILAELSGGDAKCNLEILHRLLDGEDIPVQKAIILNAGACLWVCEKASSLEAGMDMAKDHLCTGKTRTYTTELISAARAYSKEN